MMKTISNKIVYELCIETTKLLQNKQDKLRKIKWSICESNIDIGYSKLSCKCCKKGWNILRKKYPIYNDVKIKCDITDINITFIFPNMKKQYSKIELKSSKKIKMPGSTINKLDINQSLIYCLRPKNNLGNYELRCSQYHNSMGKTDLDLFQDRTPRPYINFNKMKKNNEFLPFEYKDKNCWVEHYAYCALNRIDKNIKCQSSWQDDMVKILKKNIINDYLKNTNIEQIKLDKITIDLESINI